MQNLARSTARTATLLLCLTAATPGQAQEWTAETVVGMAKHARLLTPPGLDSQIDRHEYEMKRGISMAYQSVAANTGPIPVEDILKHQCEVAIQHIKQHKPFSEVIFQMGVVAYFVALVNDPVGTFAPDQPIPTYAADYFKYLEAANKKFAVLYYGEGRHFETPAELDQLVARSQARARRQAPYVAQEYRRIGTINGRKLFDDRSTAFGIGALAYSHTVSDIVGVLRYIWIQAGGTDLRNLPPLDADHLILISPGASKNRGLLFNR